MTGGFWREILIKKVPKMRKGKIKTPLADGIPGAGDASHIMVVICGIRNIRSKEEKKKKTLPDLLALLFSQMCLLGINKEV